MKPTRRFITLATAAAFMMFPAVEAQASVTQGRATQLWGTVAVGGKVVQRSPFLTYGGTTYFGIWYLEQLLKKQGIDPSWDGVQRNLSIEWFPKFNAGSHITLNGQTLPSAHTMDIDGSVYVDANAIAKAENWPISYKVDSSGNKILTIGNGASPIKSQKSIPKKKLPLVKPTTVAATQKWGSVTGFQNVPIVQSQGTSFFGVWYLMQLLKQYGYGSSWTAKTETLSIGQLPVVIPDGNLLIGRNAEPSAFVSYQGHWYLPLSTLFLGTNISASADSSGNVTASTVSSNLGSVTTPVVTPTTVSGTIQSSPSEDLTGSKIAILDANNNVTVANVSPTDGSFSANINTVNGNVIGLYTKEKGWVGEAVPISADSHVSLDTAESTSVISGVIVPMAGEKIANSKVVLRSDLTHAQFTTTTDASGNFKMTVPKGQYEVWTVGVDGQDVFLGQRFTAADAATDVTVNLPALPTGSTYVTGHSVIEAQTSDIKPADLLSLGNMFNRIYDYDTSQTGLAPTLPIVIQAYGNTVAYTQHFRDEGASEKDAENYGENSQAVTESSQFMVVNLDGLDPEFGVNVLAHEFTHALIANVSQKIPDWVNEGIAWHQGNGAEQDISPVELVNSSLNWNVWDDIVNHAAKGDLAGLGQVDTMSANYNVEAQDYFAVEELIQTYGLKNVIDYVKNIDKTDVNPNNNDVAFQNEFGISEPSFASKVQTELTGYASHKDAGMSVTIHILPNGPTRILVSNPSGQTVEYDGATPEGSLIPGTQQTSSGTYTFKFNVDGTVVAPVGLTAGTPTSVDGDGNWYIGANYGTEQGLFSISNDYNLGFLADTLDFIGNNDPIIEISSELPIGLKLVSIQPN